MPAFIGVDERDGVVHAIVTEYLPDALDGWDWYVDDVEAWLDDTLTFDSSDRLGAANGRDHGAVAHRAGRPAAVDASTSAASPTRPMADLRLAKDRLDGLEWLDEQRRRERVCGHCATPATVAGHRIHGDLHAGQFLRAGEMMLVTDFDGNPLQDLDGRARPQSPLRDVASMVQSIVHVGAVVVKRRRPDRAADVDRHRRRHQRHASDAYAAVHPVDDRPAARVPCRAGAARIRLFDPTPPALALRRRRGTARSAGDPLTAAWTGR